jgi:hypothetical protein
MTIFMAAALPSAKNIFIHYHYSRRREDKQCHGDGFYRRFTLRVFSRRAFKKILLLPIGRQAVDVEIP